MNVNETEMTLAEAGELAHRAGLHLNCRHLSGEWPDMPSGCGLAIDRWVPGTGVVVSDDASWVARLIPLERARQIIVEVSGC